MHIGESIKAHAAREPEKSAIIYNETSRTYAEAHAKIEGHRRDFAAKAGKMKIGHPICVALDLIEQDEQLLAFLAVASLGWVGVPCNPSWSEEERAYALELAEVDVLFTDKHEAAPCLVWKEQERFTFLVEQEKPTAKGSDLFYTGFTSGSTGKPKAYVRTHQSWSASFHAASEVFELHSSDRVSVPGSLFHSLFLFAAVHTLYLGATLCLERSFSPNRVKQTVRDEGVSVMYAVPTMIQAMMEEGGDSIEEVGALIVSGAKWDKCQIEQAASFFPMARLIEFYGASELSFVSYINHSNTDLLPTAVGTLFPGVRVEVDSEEQLYVQSPYLFAGYKGNSAPVDWQTVGDLGYVDENGVLHVKGRKGNMLIIGGNNIYPEEVERLAKEMPFVEEAIAVGTDHAYWGKQMELYIKGSTNLPANAKKQMRAFLKEQLPQIKRPRRIHFVETYPLLASGKINRQALAGEKSE